MLLSLALDEQRLELLIQKQTSRKYTAYNQSVIPDVGEIEAT